MWTGHTWRKQGSLIKRLIEEDPIGKRPRERSKLRWEYCAKKEIKEIGPNI